MYRATAPACAALALVLAATLPHAGAASPRSVNVAIETSAGTVVVRLEAARAPGTVQNFLALVDAHRYDGASFYRTVDPARIAGSRIDVVQGGLEKSDPNRMAQLSRIALEPPAKSGLHNVDGTIAMAREPDPNSATSEFFINLGDDRFLDDYGGGYAVFGTVIRGHDVLVKINRAPAIGDQLTPPIRINRIRRTR